MIYLNTFEHIFVYFMNRGIGRIRHRHYIHSCVHQHKLASILAVKEEKNSFVSSGSDL